MKTQPEFSPKRNKLHSQKALAFQKDVYRLHHKDGTVRTIATALKRPPSSVQRALEAARELAGDRYEVTANSKNVVFAEIEKCTKCREELAAWGHYCKKHDQMLAAATNTVPETKIDNEEAQHHEFKDEVYWYDEERESATPLRRTKLDLP